MRNSIECAILSGMICSLEVCDKGLNILVQEEFQDDMARRIFRSMQTLRKRGQFVDLVTISPFFSNTELPQVIDMTSDVGTAAGFDSYVAELKESYKRRLLIDGLHKVETMAIDEDPNSYDELKKLTNILDSIGTDEVKYITEEDVGLAIADIMGQAEGIKMGFPKLDNHLNGLVPGRLYIVAGRPSMGKSAFAMNIACSVCKQGGVVSFFTLEDSKTSLTQRMICHLAKVSMRDIKEGQDVEKMKRVQTAMSEIKDYRMSIIDKGSVTVQDIITNAYRIRQKEGKLDAVIIDYLQLMKTHQRKNGTRQQEIGEVTRALKLFAKDIGTTVVLLSQLNRSVDDRNGGEPKMSDLRESGDIEQDADVIMFPFRPWVYDKSKQQTEARLILAKAKNTNTGNVEMYWNGECFTYREVLR